MKGIINFLIIIVAIGGISLFATFFIILGLHKKQIWEEMLKHINFKGE